MLCDCVLYILQDYQVPLLCTYFGLFNMGKLNIAHHKSYHPYRRDNIERVRRDEEEAAQKEAEAEGRVVLADAEARLDVLRDRAGLGKGKGKKKEDDLKAIEDAKVAIASSSSNQGHINLFEDLEQQEMITAIRATKKNTQLETERGVPLAPSAKDLRPWYSERDKEKEYPENEKNERLRYAVHTTPRTKFTKSCWTFQDARYGFEDYERPSHRYHTSTCVALIIK